MKLIDADKYEIDLLKAYDDVTIELDVLNKQHTVDAIIIPDNATNGDMIMTMFNCMIIEVSKGKVYVEHIYFPFDEEWWNAPYRENCIPNKYDYSEDMELTNPQMHR